MLLCVIGTDAVPAETEDNVISPCVYEFKLVAEVGRQAKQAERSLLRNQVLMEQNEPKVDAGTYLEQRE